MTNLALFLPQFFLLFVLFFLNGSFNSGIECYLKLLVRPLEIFFELFNSQTVFSRANRDCLDTVGFLRGLFSRLSPVLVIKMCFSYLSFNLSELNSVELVVFVRMFLQITILNNFSLDCLLPKVVCVGVMHSRLFLPLLCWAFTVHVSDCFS
jgi:hypothetical protein